MSRGGASGARMWAAADLRRRWRSLVVLGVLAGVTAGFAVAAAAGARRTDSALPRLRTTSHAGDALVFASQVAQFHPNFAALRARPEVAKVAVWDLAFGADDMVLFASDDGMWGRDVDRPVVLEGRMWNPKATDEVVVDENLTKDAPLGSTMPLKMIGPTLDDLYNNRATGPLVKLKVVGVVRTVGQFLFATDGQAFLPPGFVQRYRGKGAIHPNADVALKPGGSMVALRHDVNHLIADGTPILDLNAVSRRVETTLSVERSALLLLALAVATAGGLLVTQALARSSSTVGDDALVLRAVGLTRREIASGSAWAHGLTAAVAAATAVATAVVASRWFPVGLGRRVDPDVGTHADWTVLAPGTAFIVVFVVATAAWRARRSSSARVGRLSTPIGWFRRQAPLTLGLGASMAFERGRGRSSIPVRPALTGAVIGVLGVVGALTIDHGLQEALRHPERAGVTWELETLPPNNQVSGVTVKPAFARALDRTVGGSAALLTREPVAIARVGTPTFSLRALDGHSGTDLAFKVLEGRAPRALGEIALGPATAKDLKVHVGDHVTFGDKAATVTVVGEALFPPDVHSEFDEGAWVVPKQYDAVVPPTSDNTNGFIAVKLPAGADADGALAALEKGLPKGSQARKSEVPVELDNLRNIGKLPVWLAVFLALLATGAVSHVLFTSAWRRRHDFAVLRALGLPRRNARLILNVQGTAIAIVGLVVGLPVGIVVGRVLWRFVTEQVPLVDVPPFTLVAVILTIPAAVVVANLLALWPGHQVVRAHPAVELSTE